MVLAFLRGWYNLGLLLCRKRYNLAKGRVGSWLFLLLINYFIYYCKKYLLSTHKGPQALLQVLETVVHGQTRSLLTSWGEETN